MNFFITNREITVHNGVESIRDDGKENAGDNLRFGSYDVNTRKFTLYKEPEKDEDLNFQAIIQKKANELNGSARFFRTLYDLLVEPEPTITKYGQVKGDVLFFIHGFNTDLEGVREAFANLNKNYVDDPHSPVKHIVIFTWPGRSPNIPYHYHDDKKDAMRSGEALARGIIKLQAFLHQFIYRGQQEACGRKIHLMVHSMGHRVLKHMMLELQEIPELFGEIMLVAADIEYNIFDQGEAFYNSINLGSRVHVYFHDDDHVLGISKFTKNFSNRLGQYGRKSVNAGLKDVYDADVSDTKDDDEWGIQEDTLNHWYYYTSSEVVNDIVKVLNGEVSGYVKR